jgi:hypothetical protein
MKVSTVFAQKMYSASCFCRGSFCDVRLARAGRAGGLAAMPVVIAQACACDQKHQAVILRQAPAAAPASTSASLSAVRNIVLGKGRDAAGEFMTAPRDRSVADLLRI